MKRSAFLLVALMGLFVAVGCFVTGHLTAGIVGGSLVVPVIGMAADASAASDIVRQLIAWGVADACGGVKLKIPVAKTANYQILSPVTSAGDASGTCFTNRGAVGAVTFTLPAAALNLAGVWYEFVGFANQTFGVAAAAATVCTFNNAGATSVTCSTAGAKIGAHIRAFCDGTSWHVIGDTVGVTYTVA